MIGLALAAAITASAPPWPTANVWTYGGSQSCASWLSDDAHKAMGTEWILGAWSGFNMAFGRMTGSKTDTAGIVGEVERACRETPSDVLVNVVHRVYNNLSALDR